LVALNKRQRMVREIVRNIAPPARRLAVVIERRIEILAPMARSKTTELVEPARVRMIRPLAAIVPFAKAASGVPGGLEGLRNGPLIRIQPLLARGDSTYPTARMVAPRQKLGPCRRTHRTYVKPVQRRTRARQRVHIRRVEIG